jgi:hypothetical protein
MKISTWVWLMFSISIAGFLMHLPTAFDTVMAGGAGRIRILCDPPTSFSCSDALMGQMGWSVLVGLGATGLVAYLQGFSTIYILPLLLLAQLFNFFLMPNFLSPGSALMATVPMELALPLNIFMNVTVVLAFSSFIRGYE